MKATYRRTVGPLGNLIPGLRELRAPLAAGSILLLAAWIAVDPSLPDKKHATGVYRSLLELGDIVSVLGKGAALGFGAYMVGSLYTSITAARVTSLERPIQALQATLRRIRGPITSTAMRSDEGGSEGAVFSAGEILTKRGVRSLRGYVREGVTAVRRTLSGVGIRLEQMERRSLPGLLGRSLNLDEPERRWAYIEAELYARVPLAFIVGWKADPAVAKGAWLCGGLLLSGLLLWQAKGQREEAGDALVDALLNERVTAPALDRLRADVDMVVAREREAGEES
jgi:hypothetical protein